MTSPEHGNNPATIDELLAAMQRRLDSVPDDREALREFLATYRRTTAAIADALRGGFFDDPAWVERWDVVFAQFYLEAFDRYLSPAGAVPRPWRLAFDAAPRVPPLIRVLLGINAHINYDLPQALLVVVTDQEFRDAAPAGRRRDRDHAGRLLVRHLRAACSRRGSRAARSRCRAAGCPCSSSPTIR